MHRGPWESDLDRRVTGLEQRVAWIDEHGTRGQGIIEVMYQQQAGQIGEIKGAVKALDDRFTRVTARQWARALPVVLALIPVYVLLFLAVFTGRNGG